MTIDLDELERIATAGDPWGYAATPKNILELIAEVRRLREERAGPGTPSARLCFLLNGLNERFPDAVDKYSSEPAEPKLLEAVDALIEDAERYQKLGELVAFGEWFIGTDDMEGPSDRHGALQQRYLDDKADMDREMDAARAKEQS
jgi:hypothetical protein